MNRKKIEFFFFVKWRTSEKTHTNLRKEELIKGTKRGRVFFFYEYFVVCFKTQKVQGFFLFLFFSTKQYDEDF